MAKVSREALRTIMGSVNSHNRTVEEKECWRRRMDELDRNGRRGRQNRPNRRNERDDPYSRRDSTHRGRAYTDRGKDNYRFRDDRRSPVAPLDRTTGSIPSGKWGHEGFWELYPEERENLPRRPMREVERRSTGAKQADLDNGRCYMDREKIKNVVTVNRRGRSPSLSSSLSSSSSSTSSNSSQSKNKFRRNKNR